MLTHLTIKNYALIRELDMDFSGGFAVITGETGAGKSILLGALALILGQRADSGVLNEKDKKCIVEGTFHLSSYGLDPFFVRNQIDFQADTTLRREINPGGNSRAFINDTPVTLGLLKDLGEKLVNIHSQYQTLTLNDSSFQLTILDHYSGLLTQMEEYRKIFDESIFLKLELKALLEQDRKLKAEKEFNQFVHDELSGAKLQEAEFEEIELELKVLENAGVIKSSLYAAVDKLNGQESSLLQQLREIFSLISKVELFLPGLKDFMKRLEDAQIELKDIAQEIEKIERHIEVDPQRLQQLQERVDILNRLEHKHHVTSIGELIRIREGLWTKLQGIQHLEDQIKTLEDRISMINVEIRNKASLISESRKNAVPPLEKEMEDMVRDLGMPDARVHIAVIPLQEPGRDGMDQVTFFFNANRGGELKELASVASGGERSRLMLCLKSLIARKTLLPTIIFDEIDAGVSGEIAGKMGTILRQMAGNMQVIAITHLPQIASKADIHYLVYKDTLEKTVQTIVKKLIPEERLHEIAKMISDKSVTASALSVAKELLKDQIDFSNRQLTINI